MRAPTNPPVRVSRWQKHPDLIEQDSEFIGGVMLRWGYGMDTVDIALDLFQPESAVERALHIGREMRRREEADGSR
jgi:hypothetical protein